MGLSNKEIKDLEEARKHIIEIFTFFNISPMEWQSSTQKIYNITHKK